MPVVEQISHTTELCVKRNDKTLPSGNQDTHHKEGCAPALDMSQIALHYK